MTTHLHIERLVLDGLPLPASAGERVRRAMEAELARLLSETSANQMSGGATERLSTAPITLDSKQPLAALGVAAARSLYKGLFP